MISTTYKEKYNITRFILGMQDWFNIKIPINVILINKLKNKHMMILVNTEKTFYKIQYLSMIKILSKKK